jgi:hypothetical protein
MSGDLVEYKRSLYSHWAVYIGDGKIIHLTSAQKLLRFEVKIDNFEDIINSCYVFINNSKDTMQFNK